MTPMDTCMEDNQKAECTARSARVASFVYTTAEMLRSSQPCSIHTYISIRKNLKLLTYIHTYLRSNSNVDRPNLGDAEHVDRGSTEGWEEKSRHTRHIAHTLSGGTYTVGKLTVYVCMYVCMYVCIKSTRLLRWWSSLRWRWCRIPSPAWARRRRPLGWKSALSRHSNSLSRSRCLPHKYTHTYKYYECTHVQYVCNALTVLWWGLRNEHHRNMRRLQSSKQAVRYARHSDHPYIYTYTMWVNWLA